MSNKEAVWKLIVLLKEYKKNLLFIMGSLLISSVLNLCIPLLSKQIMDFGFMEGNYELLIKLVLLSTIIYIANLFIDVIKEEKRVEIFFRFCLTKAEFCGLTKSDLDFESRKIRVDHQFVRERGGKYYVEKTKTECGCRFIPMTEDVFQSLKNILTRRKKLKTEMIVDGYSSFLLLDKDDKPKVALHIENEMRWAMKKYKKLYPDRPLPHITPHVFRHTFCTNMANAGMDIKTLQYVMGHSDVGVTLNVYTHASYDRAAEQMAKILEFKENDTQGKQRKSG